ncbi:hypothetical protein HGRIS_001301 [Hohenbuehelia grisea]|uniref:Uncharacterized protein n=1 Tax=Hohenbuehelia grisea TaxID=104357 RepID=A0ABR3JQ73_9AGAR
MNVLFVQTAPSKMPLRSAGIMILVFQWRSRLLVRPMWLFKLLLKAAGTATNNLINSRPHSLRSIWTNSATSSSSIDLALRSLVARHCRTHAGIIDIDDDDDDYPELVDDSDSEDDSSDSEDELVANDEVCPLHDQFKSCIHSEIQLADILPSKTNPNGLGKRTARSRRRQAFSTAPPPASRAL